MIKINNIKRQTMIMYILIFFVSFIILALPIKNILMGTYSWHIKRDAVIQGLIELFIYFIASLFIIKFINNKKILIISILSILCFYLQAHSALFAFIIIWLYFEIIIQIGNIIKILLLKENTETLESYLTSFLIGFIIWSAIAIFCSFINEGSIKSLRIVTIILGIVCLFSKIKIAKNKLFVEKIIKVYLSCTKLQMVLCTGIFFLILIQCVKGTRVVDFDSLWYGLFTDRLLFGSKSFFESFGLLHYVHYYPKLLELFCAPFSDFNIFSFIYSINIMFYFFVLLVCYRIMKTVKLDTTNALILVFPIGTLPCFANMATTAKTDVSTTFFLLLIILFIIIYFLQKKENYLYLVILSCLSSMCLKPHALFYLFQILIGVFVLIIYLKYKDNKKILFKITDKNNIIKYSLLIGINIFVVFGIYYRTYKLTGYPTYPIIVGLWKKLHFQGVYPFENPVNNLIKGLGNIQGISFYFNRIYNILFDPTKVNARFDNSWTGNIFIWLFFIIISIIIFNIVNKKQITKSVSTEIKIFIIVTIPISVISIIFTIFWYPLITDGNYLIFPICISIIMLGSVIISILTKNNVQSNVFFLGLNKNIFYAIFILLICLQFIIMFVSHFSWIWGTDIFSFNVKKPIYRNRLDYIEWSLEHRQLTDIENFLISCGLVNPRILGVENEDFILSCRYESYNISGLSGVFDTHENFIKYINWANIDFILVPKDEERKKTHKSFISYIQYLIDNNQASIITFNAYDLINISYSINNVIIKKSGFHENDSWTNGDANMIFINKTANKFSLTGFCPAEWSLNRLTVTINDNESMNVDMFPGEPYYIEIDFKNNLNMIYVNIKTEKTFIPKNEGWNDDTRELGAYILSWELSE
jgi:hypothetical protein